MARRRRFLVLGLAVAFAAAGGTAWAITSGEEAKPRLDPAVAPTTGTLAEGPAPSGGDYVLSRINPGELGPKPAEGVCTEIRTAAARARGCHPVPDEDGSVHGQPWRPAMAVLGTDRFFMTIAPAGVATMEVRVEGETEATVSRTIDTGPAGNLLFVAVGGPLVTSRDPASSRDYQVRLVDAAGETVQAASSSDPGDR